MSNPFLEAALEYREAGLTPIPLLPRSKLPAIAWKEFQTRMPSVEEIQGWWAANPDMNVGILVVGKHTVVDIDGREGEQALAQAGIVLPADTPRVKTAHGHHHWLQTSGEGDRIGLLQKVDIRRSGYVVAPPSIHESGHVYTWEQPLDGPLKAVPATLRALLDAPKAPVDQPEKWLTLALDGVGEGSRDQTCYRLASYFVGKGVPLDVIQAVLELWADRCDPPFDHGQVAIKVHSASKHEVVEDGGGPASLSEALDLAVSEILALPEARKVIPTHLPTLDGFLAGGIRPGEYVLIGARPSVGKTALAMQWALKAARRGEGVLVISREMSKAALATRIISSAGRLRGKGLKLGPVSDENPEGMLPMEIERLRMIVEELRPLPLWITNDCYTVAQIREQMNAYQSLGLVIVDYIQLLHNDEQHRDSRQAIGQITTDLRALAITSRIPIIALSQLTRPDKGMNPHKWIPQLSDLIESGALEASADIVILLNRVLGERETRANLAKNRDGQTGNFDLMFNPQIFVFEERT